MQCKRALVVLCGLPGAGKTTTAKLLVDHWTSTTSFNVIHVEFDAVERLIRRDVGVDDGPCETAALQAWREARRKAIEDVEEALGSDADQDSKANVVLVDDNMYYGSMRHQMFSMAGRHRAGFVQVYLKVSVEAAVEANTRRPSSEQVSGEVIRRMSEKIEPPSMEESHVLHLRTRPELAVVAANPNFTEALSWKSPCDAITRVVEDALIHPKEPFDAAQEEARKEQAEASRAEVQRNAIHQTDQALCKQVSQYIASFPRDKRREASENARRMKKTFTSDLRERVSTLLPRIQAQLQAQAPSIHPQPETVALVVQHLSTEFQDRLDGR